MGVVIFHQSETETGTKNEINTSHNIVFVWQFYAEGLKSYQCLVVVAFVGKFLVTVYWSDLDLSSDPTVPLSKCITVL